MATTLKERRHLDRMARRRSIQRIARRAFGERGFGGATIEDIARKAGLSVGAIYLYFKGKEELSVSLLQDSLERLAAEMEGVLVEPDEPRSRLRAAWQLLVEWSPTFRDLFRILPPVDATSAGSSLRQRVSDEVAAGLAQAAARSLALVAMVIGEGVAAGAYRAECRETGPYLLWATFAGLIGLQGATESLDFAAPDFAATCQTAFETLERGLLA